MLKKLWNDEAGFVTLEYLFGATVLVIGLVVGLTALRNSINAEVSELGEAIMGLNQGYTIGTQSYCNSSVTGSNVIDATGNQIELVSGTETATDVNVAVEDCTANP
jgi:Flp pilus assembly pilin Flp